MPSFAYLIKNTAQLGRKSFYNTKTNRSIERSKEKCSHQIDAKYEKIRIHKKKVQVLGMQSVYFCRIRIADTELWIRGRTISTWTNTVSGYTLRRREPQGRLFFVCCNSIDIKRPNGNVQKYGLQSISIEWLEFIASCNLLQKPLLQLFSLC